MRITVNEAADMLERSPEFIRIALQQKALPIGIAIRMHGSTRYTYYINPPDLAKYMNGNICSNHVQPCTAMYNHVISS